ncbi:uncharacterized protein LOC143600221, partial [Bidens hawaiensis]|uniref:uncharacterized protein LOC143600221 n=1 Tax=Bidens hawaiensis TaxID=980011 RepID=UPI00404A98F1
MTGPTPNTSNATPAVHLTTPANVGATAMANHAEIPEKFTGVHFKRWQQKMFFYLTTLNLAQFLEKTAPIPTAQDDAQSVSALDAWKHSEFLCLNYVLNGLADPLYNVYCGIKSAKELWESLDKKKTIKRLKNQLVWSQWLRPTWLNLDNPKGGHKGKGKMNKGKGKVNLGLKKEVVKKKPQSSNFQGVCYNCNENGHHANQCKKPKRERVHMVDENGEPLVAMITELSAVIEEINLVGDKLQGWFIDTGATRHVCGDKTLFSTFKEAASDAKLFMGNQATVDIKGEGN